MSHILIVVLLLVQPIVVIGARPPRCIAWRISVNSWIADFVHTGIHCEKNGQLILDIPWSKLPDSLISGTITTVWKMCPIGDLNQDCQVDMFDVIALIDMRTTARLLIFSDIQRTWKQDGRPQKSRPRWRSCFEGDLNGDCWVDSGDFTLLINANVEESRLRVFGAIQRRWLKHVGPECLP